MPPREKKSYARSKKFEEIRESIKTKQQERSIQKKTGYERDIRTMMKTILEPVRAAEEGRGEITREELVLIRNRIEKMITRIRVLTGNEGVNLSFILSKVTAEKALLMDYITGKRELAGKVTKHGEGGERVTAQPTGAQPTPTPPRRMSDNNRHEPDGNDEFDDDDVFGNHGFSDDEEEVTVTSKENFYKNLGFDDVEEEEFNITAKPTSKNRQSTNNVIIRTQPVMGAQQQSESFRRMCLNLIDDKMSQIITQGIEHLMLLRKKMGKGTINYRDEIIKYFNDEIIFTKNLTLEELRKKGYPPDQLRFYSNLYDREFEINETLMIRKCLYLSRVLEYRKGSTSTG